MKKIPPQVHLQNGAPKLTIFQHFKAPDGSEMAQVQNSSYQIEPIGGAQEYEHQTIGQLNFHWGQMLLYCELYHVNCW